MTISIGYVIHNKFKVKHVSILSITLPFNLAEDSSGDYVVNYLLSLAPSHSYSERRAKVESLELEKIELRQMEVESKHLLRFI